MKLQSKTADLGKKPGSAERPDLQRRQALRECTVKRVLRQSQPHAPGAALLCHRAPAREIIPKPGKYLLLEPSVTKGERRTASEGAGEVQLSAEPTRVSWE